MQTTITLPIPMGSTIRDTVTGLTGVAVAFAAYKNGCSRYSIQPPVDKDGKNVQGMWVDEQDVELVACIEPAEQRTVPGKTGGPQSSPSAFTPPPLT